MIVLDEQLLGRKLEEHLAAWYSGTVCFVTDLRPNSIIKDDAIPLLLRQQSQPTFVTINERDFWRKVAIDDTFCVICFTLSDSRAYEIALLLRSVL
jgi:predicted GTPase